MVIPCCEYDDKPKQHDNGELTLMTKQRAEHSRMPGPPASASTSEQPLALSNARRLNTVARQREQVDLEARRLKVPSMLAQLTAPFPSWHLEVV